MTRDVDPRAGEMSFRQVPLYRIPNDAHVPVSTAAEAFLTELDFEKTAFLAAVDRKTKAPEVHIPGVDGYRGALSYALARALEGAADADRDGKVTLKELFTLRAPGRLSAFRPAAERRHAEFSASRASTVKSRSR